MVEVVEFDDALPGHHAVGEGHDAIVAIDPIGSLGAAERVLLREQPVVDLGELSAQALGDEALEEARPEVIHEEKLRAHRDQRAMGCHTVLVGSLR